MLRDAPGGMGFDSQLDHREGRAPARPMMSEGHDGGRPSAGAAGRPCEYRNIINMISPRSQCI